MKNVVLQFGANYCLPCKFARQYIKSIGGEDKIHFINIEENELLAKEYKITNIPTFVKLNVEGVEICRFTGYDEEMIKAFVESK